MRPSAGQAREITGASAAVQREYAQLAERYERRWRGYLEASVSETLRRIQVRPEQRVLDVACGTGVLAARLRERGAGVVGIDLSPQMLLVAGRKPWHLHLAMGDAHRLPLRDGSFDLVVSISSLHYWPSPARALAEMRRVLVPGGQLVLTDWCGDSLLCRVRDFLLRRWKPAHHRAYGAAEWRALLEHAGFANVVLERYDASWCWPLLTARASVPPT